MNYIESQGLTAQNLMEKDSVLLHQLEPEAPCILHLYEWAQPCLTYGYFTPLSDYLHLSELKAMGLEAAIRPTGGGIIFHLTDLAFSVLIPADSKYFSTNTLENYAFINRQVTQVINSFLKTSLTNLQESTQTPSHSNTPRFCMAHSTIYDLVIDGKKVGGAAQRRTKKGLLHQASISVSPPPIELLDRVIKDKKTIVKSMEDNSYYLLPKNTSHKELEEARSELRHLLKATLQFHS